MKLLLCSLLLVLATEAQTQNDLQGADTGAYVHNPDWDLTPFQLFQLKKKGISTIAKQPAAAPAAVIPAQPAVLPAVQAFRPPVDTTDVRFQSFPAQQQRPAVRQQQQLQQAFRVQQQPAVPAAPAVQQLPTSSQFQISTDFRSPAAAVPAPAVRFQPAVAALPAPAVRFQPAAASLPAAASPQQTAEFIAAATRHPDPNFWSRSWSYSAPTYSAQAEGSSYSYTAQF